jgi:hypothetical protein
LTAGTIMDSSKKPVTYWCDTNACRTKLTN